MISAAPRGLGHIAPYKAKVGGRLLGAALGLALVFGILPSAHADVAKAKAHYERGQALYQVGEYRRALDEFKEAHVEKPDPAFLYNIAQCFRQLGDSQNALTFYRRYLSLAPEGPMRGDAERRIQELESGAAAPAQPSPGVQPARPAVVPPPQIKMEAASVTEIVPPPSPSSSASPRPPLPRWLPWAGAGATIILGAFATARGLSASSRFDELRGTCGQTAEGCTPEQVDSIRSRARTANIVWALAGIAALGTGATVYVNTREAGFAGIWKF